MVRMTEQQAHGCAVRMLWCLVIIAIWIAMTYGVSKLGSMAIEALIPDADAVEITAPTTVPTTTDAKVVGEFVEEFVGESSKVEGKVESTVTILAEPTPELPRPTVGEVDAEAEENFWIEDVVIDAIKNAAREISGMS